MQSDSDARPSGHEPMRTCIATRQSRPAHELLRVVAQGSPKDVVVPDPKRKLPGRGAWIIPTLAALDIAEQRKAFGRALRVSGNLDTGPVRTYITALSLDPTTDQGRLEH